MSRGRWMPNRIRPNYDHYVLVLEGMAMDVADFLPALEENQPGAVELAVKRLKRHLELLDIASKATR